MADEVRKLAEQSAQSADEIGKILSRVTSGVGAVQEAIVQVVGETRKGAEAGTAEEALKQIESITKNIAASVV